MGIDKIFGVLTKKQRIRELRDVKIELINDALPTQSPIVKRPVLHLVARTAREEIERDAVAIRPFVVPECDGGGNEIQLHDVYRIVCPPAEHIF